MLFLFNKQVTLGLILCFMGLSAHVTPSYASDLYFLCGPDEDGCFDDDYTSCACISYDDEPSTPHCLDFNNLECVPLSKVLRCPKNLTFKDQGSCLATIFHSTQLTPCHVKTRDFCIAHRIQFCEHNGNPHNCHASINLKQ